jgi:type I restriction enzyme S subunit
MSSRSWQQITVRELVDKGQAEIKTGPFGTQLHASDYVDTGTPVINARNIGFGNIREDKLEYISDETVNRLSSHLLRPADIVFGRKGTVERHVFIQQAQNNWFQGTDCLRLRLKSPDVEPRYVSYFLTTEHHKQWIINQSSHGATMTSLNQDIISRISFPLPPLPVQRKIADVLSAYDDLIEVNTRRIRILEQMAQSVYREWFGKMDGNSVSDGWEKKTLGDIAKEVRRSVQPNEIDPETPYFGLEHLPRKSIALSEWGKASDVKSTKLSFKEGEILFGKIRPYFHKVGVAPLDGVSSTDAIVITPKKPDYFGLTLSYVSSEDFVNHATQTSQGTKMPRANWDVLVKYPILIPPEDVLRKHNDFMHDMVNMIQNLLFSNRKLRRTRDLLLPRLVSGEVGVEQIRVDENG